YHASLGYCYPNPQRDPLCTRHNLHRFFFTSTIQTADNEDLGGYNRQREAIYATVRWAGSHHHRGSCAVLLVSGEQPLNASRIWPFTLVLPPRLIFATRASSDSVSTDWLATRGRPEPVRAERRWRVRSGRAIP